MARKQKAPAGMRYYDAYRFRDKDPAIDAIRTVMQDHFGKRKLSKEDYDEISANGGPSGATVRHWFEGETKRPQNATLEAAGRALGYHRVWRKMSEDKVAPRAARRKT